MGITAFDIKLIERALEIKPDIQYVMEMGAQSLYLTASDKPPFASEWYTERKIAYECIDLSGDNNAEIIDLSKPIPEFFYWIEQDGFTFEKRAQLLTDFGTGEHCVQMDGYHKVSFHDGHINSIYPDKVVNIIEGFYNFWLNKHNLLQMDGIMISVNPLTGNWPGHGYSYLTEQFYHELVANTDYEIIELGTHPASGNNIDGWNVHCILKKHSDRFPDLETFKTFDIRQS